MIKRVVMINNSHFIVEFPEKTDSAQYKKREIIDEAAALTGVSMCMLPTDLPIVKLQYSWGGGHKLCYRDLLPTTAT